MILNERSLKRLILVCLLILGFYPSSYCQNNSELSTRIFSDSAKSNTDKDKFNRTLLEMPVPSYTSKHTGKVVINVWIDKDGFVIDAKPDSLKSSTLNKDLIGNAIQAAYKARFSIIKKDTIEKGSITYNYLKK
jgi:hypothetical protein